MTTTELARIIGVSRITLSKVINKKGGVSAETEARIQEYIKNPYWGYVIVGAM